MRNTLDSSDEFTIWVIPGTNISRHSLRSHVSSKSSSHYTFNHLVMVCIISLSMIGVILFVLASMGCETCTKPKMLKLFSLTIYLLKPSILPENVSTFQKLLFLSGACLSIEVTSDIYQYKYDPRTSMGGNFWNVFFLIQHPSYV